MKIPASIRTLYDDQKEPRQLLKTRVDNLLKPRLRSRWHYESRVKEIESFTIKIESGRVHDPSALEDFFAATIVVRNGLEVAEAEVLIEELFSAYERRPKVDAETHKSPDQFQFDDLRLYVRWKDDATLPPSGLNGLLFEIQVKTFLQHAWSIATHDLIYKADDANWSKMRIAYQIKAMLEHAEVSIQEATLLSKCSSLAKSDSRTTSLKAFIDLITGLWPQEDLPGNIRGLAENVMRLSLLVNLHATDLKGLLEKEQEQGRGPLTRNLTPYGVVFQTLLLHRRREVDAALNKEQGKMQNKKPYTSILIPRELDLPQDLDVNTWKTAIILK